MTIEYVLLDNPSDHEVDDGVVTECDVIRAILSNRGLGKKVKLVRSSTTTRFTSQEQATMSVKFVHLAGHGNQIGLGLIGGSVGWTDVAKEVKALAKPLAIGRSQRVLCVSCCYSKEAARTMSTQLSTHFTAMYYFTEEKIEFAKAMAVWSLFYLEKNFQSPEGAIVDRINRFFDHEVLAIMLTKSGRERRKRLEERRKLRRKLHRRR